MAAEYLLEMENIEKSFPGVKALNQVTLRVRPGTVHALMGENGAGKSTLMKCLFGLYRKDAGTIKIDGEEVDYTDPKDALEHGVSMVHQELNQVLRRNVMENIWLGRFPKKHGFVDHKKMYEETKRLMAELGIEEDPDVELSTISVSRRQMIEIAKAVSYNVKVLVLDEPTCHHVSFELHKGEILGISGLVGSRRTELLETIFGVAHHREGQLYKDGKPIHNRNSQEAFRNGFAFVTEERRATGIFPQADIRFNTTIANIKKYRKGLLLSDKNMGLDTQKMIDVLAAKTPSQKTKIQYLSGGSQQKVIIARWLLADPDILLLDEPTRGIDVGAKYEIYQLIINLAKEGKAVIFVSSEMPELLGVCDRIMVMSGGKQAGILDREELSEEAIMRLSVKYV